MRSYWLTLRTIAWRSKFWVYYGPLGQWIACWAILLLQKAKGHDYALKKLFEWSRRVYPKGIAATADGFTIQGSRFRMAILRRLNGSPPVEGTVPPARPKVPERLRIGILCHFSGALSFGYEFAAGGPFGDHDIFFYDVPFFDGHLDRIGSLPSSGYRRVSTVNTISNAVDLVHRDHLDVLGVIGPKAVYELLDHLRVPCVVGILAGKDLIHHESVGVHMISMHPPSWIPKNHRVFCTISRRFISHPNVYFTNFVYDSRGIVPPVDVSRKKREPFFFSHATASKFLWKRYFSVVIQLMREFPDYTFRFMARDTGSAVETICDKFSAAGFRDRVRYEGSFEAKRNAEGIIPDPGWARCRDFLSRATLALDSWPRPGGSSRFEAYISGLPAVHMAVPENPGLGGLVSYATACLPYLSAPLGRAYDPKGYLEIARRVIQDERYWEDLARQQLDCALSQGNANRWWHEFLACYEDWNKRQFGVGRGA